jgi:hypothetical protein
LWISAPVVRICVVCYSTVVGGPTDHALRRRVTNDPGPSIKLRGTSGLSRMNGYGYSIFCDDIRNEPGGKLSLIGCYNGAIFISGRFPLVLPKLCVYTHILFPASQPVSSIVIRCYLPGDEKPNFEEPVDLSQQHDQTELIADMKTDDGWPLFIVAASLIFAPLELRSAGRMRVQATINTGREIMLGSLRIEQPPLL